MKKKYFLDLLDQAEISKKLFVLISFYAVITTGYFQIAPEKTDFLYIPKNYVVGTYPLLFLLIIFIFALEIFWYLFGDKLFIFKTLVGGLLNVINASVKFIFHWLYIFPLKLLLEPVFVELSKEYTTTEENGEHFFFVNQKIGVVSDDHYFYRELSAKRLSIKAKPTRMYPRWRLGLKFSLDGVFTGARHDKDYILFHLTKDQGRERLDYHLYEGGEPKTEILVPDYQGQTICLEVLTNQTNTIIKVQDINEQTIKQVEIPKQKSAQLFAWADGQSNFELETYINEEK